MASMTRTLMTTAALAIVAACGGDDQARTAMNDDLRRDLDAVATPSDLALAGTGAGYEPMRVVSPIEQVNGAVPVQRAPRPRPVPQKPAGAAETEESPAPQVANEVVASEEPTSQPGEEAPDSDVPRVPVVAPRPAPLPVDAAEGEAVARGRGNSTPPEIEEVIGVVIRGGVIGTDRCPPRRGGPRGGPRGFPFPEVRISGVPVIRPTVPR